MKVRRSIVGAAAMAAALTFVVGGQSPGHATNGNTDSYTVVAADGVSADKAIAAITALGGKVTARNEAIGVYEVTAPAAKFVSAAANSSALVGAAHVKPVGVAPKAPRPRDVIAKEGRGAASAPGAAGHKPPTAGMDPLDSKLWGLKMVGSDKARKVNAGSRQVKVGVIDTGLDASNPDIAANYDAKLSRNFAKDIPEVDGPCEEADCWDKPGTDDGGHGTHVGGTIGAAANGTGLSGVAPNVTLVGLKAGQDSGFFFLGPTVNALTHAADNGIDVVNMSFYVDPWLYNCTANAADTPEQQAEQRTIIKAMTRALLYARAKGVTLVAALGNNHEDIGKPRTDISSPDYPPSTPPHPRPIDNNTCWDLPTEGPGVISVSALGPSSKKADYSNYGTEQTVVSAPGGYFRDGFGTPTFRTVENMILSTYPKKVLQEEGSVDADGNIVPGHENEVFKACTAAGKCGYYTYLQGTSMASPHAAGVAALVVSRFGKHDPRYGGLRLEPWKVESLLTRTATKTACPVPPLVTYENEGRPAEFNALCEGSKNFNGFYGNGIVNAHAVVTAPPAWG